MVISQAHTEGNSACTNYRNPASVLVYKIKRRSLEKEVLYFLT